MLLLELLFSREDESQPGARGAWSFSELNSLALLIWSLTCSSLTFCLSSHLLRSQSLFLFSFFWHFHLFKVPWLRSWTYLTLRVPHVFFTNKRFTVKTYFYRVEIESTCQARVTCFFSSGSDIPIQTDSHVFLGLILTCFPRGFFCIINSAARF